LLFVNFWRFICKF